MSFVIINMSYNDDSYLETEEVSKRHPVDNLTALSYNIL